MAWHTFSLTMRPCGMQQHSLTPTAFSFVSSSCSFRTTSHSHQIGYFRYCRDILSDHSDKSHLIATEHYREAKEFAKWSSQDRAEKRAQLPPLTPEQEKQMKAYLRMMQGRCKFLLVFPPPLPGSDAPMVLLTHNFAPPTPIPPLPP